MKSKTNPRIKLGEHVLIAGMTGCGKSALAKVYLANQPNVVVLDTKRTFNFDIENEDTNQPMKFAPDKDITIVERLSDIPSAKTRLIIYRPTWDEQTKEMYNAFFKWCFRRGKCIVYVDEMMQIAPGGRQEAMPDFGRALYTQGRELGVSIWASTQRPANIPLMCLSEAKHWFIFTLQVESDRLRIYKNSGYDVFLEKIAWHTFYYWQTNSNKPPVHGKIELPD